LSSCTLFVARGSLPIRNLFLLTVIALLFLLIFLLLSVGSYTFIALLKRCSFWTFKYESKSSVVVCYWYVFSS
jgi:maltodextrin utilization protein YvdJ